MALMRSATGRERLVGVGAKFDRQGRYAISQMSEPAFPRERCADSLRRSDRLRQKPVLT